MSVSENEYYFNTIEIGLALIDVNGKFIRVNPYFCEIMGYSQLELEQRNFRSITHPEDINECVSELEKLYTKKNDRFVLLKDLLIDMVMQYGLGVITESITDERGNIKEYFQQIIPLKNGAREQIRKAENKIEIIEQINVGRFIQKNIWKITQIIAICLATILGYLFTVGTKMFADANRLDRIEKILEEKAGK